MATSSPSGVISRRPPLCSVARDEENSRRASANPCLSLVRESVEAGTLAEGGIDLEAITAERVFFDGERPTGWLAGGAMLASLS